MSQMINV